MDAPVEFVFIMNEIGRVRQCDFTIKMRILLFRRADATTNEDDEERRKERGGVVRSGG
jgi:hypothetical protein